MYKEMAKRVVRDAGLPIVPYLSFKHERWKKDKQAWTDRIQRELGYPVFVKPANLGSSVGVQKCADSQSVEAAADAVFKYDMKILVETAIDAREIELAVLENCDPGAEPLVSVP